MRHPIIIIQPPPLEGYFQGSGLGEHRMPAHTPSGKDWKKRSFLEKGGRVAKKVAKIHNCHRANGLFEKVM